MSKMKKGFSLIEMLVVIGIIATLSAAALMTFGKAGDQAMRTHCQELVHDTATALALVMQDTAGCPAAILAASGGDHKLSAEVGAELARRKLMSFSYEEKVDATTGLKTYRLVGIDQCGVVSPWAAVVVKRLAANGTVSTGQKVPSGGTIDDHILRFSVDDDEDGLVRAERDGRQVMVRGESAVWCCGADGRFGTADDVRSWAKGQEDR